MRPLLPTLLLTSLVSFSAFASPVGEAHLRTTSPTGALRSAAHDPELRVTVWYPSVDGAVETPRTIGPPAAADFEGGSASDGAPLATGPSTLPVILLSHGFGGSARMMSWLGTELARHGYLVVAVDHPGNNGSDPMTRPGAILWWDRVDDLHDAWDAVLADPRFARHVDPSRLGVAGFSAGGFTALVAAGARIDLAHFDRFCAEEPEDGVCRPQAEMPGMSGKDRGAAFDTAVMKDAEGRATAHHAIPGVRAAFVLAPALLQALEPDSLRQLAVPTVIMLGSADRVAPPATNGDYAARLIPGAKLLVLGQVGHYDFLSTCTQAGRATVPLCGSATPQDETHREAVAQAVALFASSLRAEPAQGR